jgi:hypothetical protein
MEKQFSESELVSFLDYLASKNLLNSSTASARKAAVIKILSAVDEDEKHDLRTLDRDLLFQRFTNKFSKDFTPDSLVTYKSRFNSALNDFFKYIENPAGFKVGRAKKSPKEGAEAKASGKKASAKTANLPYVPLPPPEPKSYVLQIPISDGILIEIRNLPMDLSAIDAKKIAAIITAHVPKES